MVALEIRTFVIEQGRTTKPSSEVGPPIVDWETFASQHTWAATAQKDWVSDDTPEHCIAIYYGVDSNSKTINHKIHVVPWSPVYKDAFRELNLAWVSSLFEVEEWDRQQLEDPESSIMTSGGEIFFLLENSEVVGTASMVMAHGEYQLGKMTIKSGHQGKGFAHPLMHECIAWAKRKDLAGIPLYTNDILVKAVSLYKRHGFKITRLGKHPSYERCNCVMYLSLKDE